MIRIVHIFRYLIKKSRNLNLLINSQIWLCKILDMNDLSRYLIKSDVFGMVNQREIKLMIFRFTFERFTNWTGSHVYEVLRSTSYRFLQFQAKCRPKLGLHIFIPYVYHLNLHPLSKIRHHVTSVEGSF